MDYKHRFPDNRYRERQKKSRTGPWALVVLVVVFIAGVVGWAVTRSLSVPAPSVQQVESATKQDASPLALPVKPVETGLGLKKLGKGQAKDSQKPDAGPAVVTQEPRFTFYKILPEKEAIIPESEIKTIKHEESLSKKHQAGQYLLQAGSFSNPQDAVKLKEKLTALKIKSHIENVKIENAAWNRVKIGPFTTLADADKVRDYLRSNQIDSVVQKAVTKPPQTPAKH